MGGDQGKTALFGRGKDGLHGADIIAGADETTSPAHGLMLTDIGSNPNRNRNHPISGEKAMRLLTVATTLACVALLAACGKVEPTQAASQTTLETDEHLSEPDSYDEIEEPDTAPDVVAEERLAPIANDAATVPFAPMKAAIASYLRTHAVIEGVRLPPELVLIDEITIVESEPTQGSELPAYRFRATAVERLRLSGDVTERRVGRAARDEPKGSASDVENSVYQQLNAHDLRGLPQGYGVRYEVEGILSQSVSGEMSIVDARTTESGRAPIGEISAELIAEQAQAAAEESRIVRVAQREARIEARLDELVPEEAVDIAYANDPSTAAAHDAEKTQYDRRREEMRAKLEAEEPPVE